MWYDNNGTPWIESFSEIQDGMKIYDVTAKLYGIIKFEISEDMEDFSVTWYKRRACVDAESVEHFVDTEVPLLQWSIMDFGAGKGLDGVQAESPKSQAKSIKKKDILMLMYRAMEYGMKYGKLQQEDMKKACNGIFTKVLTS